MKDGDIPAHLRKALDRLIEVIDRMPDARSPDPYDAITIMVTEDGSRANKRVCLFDGGLKKEPPPFGSMYAAAKIIVPDHATLRRVLEVVGEYTDVTLVPGVVPDTAPGLVHVLVSAKRLTGQEGQTDPVVYWRLAGRPARPRAK